MTFAQSHKKIIFASSKTFKFQLMETNHSSPLNPLRKKPRHNPEAQFQFNLNTCSKSKDLRGAIALYESAVSDKTKLNHHHLNTLLYLCSQAVNESSNKELAIEYGFRIFSHMQLDGFTPNEASITAISRIAAAKGDGDYAFGLIKKMENHGLVPRLRTYDPALFSFTQALEAEKAYEVEEHMDNVGVSAEEPEVAALLKVSAETGRGERVYGYLQKLRKIVRCVSEDTANIIENWFSTEKACEVSSVDYKLLGLATETVSKNGGGWHGLGWMGKGKWIVERTNVNSNSHCCSCGKQLACIDIEEIEKENFAQSVADLALEREAKANFSVFQEWLEKHGDYEAIVDGANVALYQQNFPDGGFSVSELDAVVKELHSRNGRWPLVILHSKRVRSLLENPAHRKLVEEWEENEVLYPTPPGSNDDWYWLYAAVKLGCLLVTNDEMRDHIFELVGSSFIRTWKERHQVRYTFVKSNLKLQMPPSYSPVIQESENGSWHFPVEGSNCEEHARTWLCITRPSALDPCARSKVQAEDNEKPQRNDCVPSALNSVRESQ